MPVHAYYEVETGSIIYHVVPSLQSVGAGSVFQSESDSSESAVTINTDEVPGYFIQYHGRQHPAGENVVRWFPSDNVKRYMLLHWVARLIFGGNYVGPVSEVLAPVLGAKRSVLELGTRAGTWVQDMATDFPHVEFRSLDIVPMIAHAPRSNVDFEVYNLAEGIMLEDESQDAVFLNFAIEMVNDYRALLREVYRVLRPGGLIHIREYFLGLWDPEDISVPAWRTNPVATHLFECGRTQLVKIGIDPDMCYKIPDWLSPSSSLWEGREEDLGFEDINSTIRSIPAHPHEGFSCMSTINTGIAPFVGHLSLMTTRDMSTLLRDGGMDAAEAEGLVDRAIEEIKQPACCANIKAYIICGRKRVNV